jgi:hypothetical protein
MVGPGRSSLLFEDGRYFAPVAAVKGPGKVKAARRASKGRNGKHQNAMEE